MEVTKALAETMYRNMLTARFVEDGLIAGISRGHVINIGHPVSGQEAVAAGACAALRKDDLLFIGHRTKHWAISKGVDLNALVAELGGKATGLAGGWGGEMHNMDESVGYMGPTHLVGGQLPMAVGCALAAELSGADNIVMVAFSDGATAQGSWHEALNLAAVYQVPILFLLENNQYAESTPYTYHSSPADYLAKAAAYGFPGERVDGQDALAVFEVVDRAVEAIRSDRKPRFIEAITYRYYGHWYGDRTSRYRSEEEETYWRDRDPLTIFAEKATGLGLLDAAQADGIREEALTAATRAVQFAEQSPLPDIAELNERLYA